MLVSVAVVLLSVVLAVPAQADKGEQDRQFLAALMSAGWTITSADVLVGKAHQICNEGFGHGVTRQEMQTTLISWGHSSRDASTLIDKSIGVYCPQYAAAISGGTAPSPGSTGPTYADGDAFTEEVHEHGILRNLYPDHVVQILANICNHASEGLSDGAIVSLYMDGYGLSQRDASWLVAAAQAKCD
ncbi:DUF732 domain-containing protein [Mycolicibacterium fluoranthenivorans]|uniref:DUF732 domain-containing protein n=1 Tax=Mycolicibacterium fluoranthenivorans TaxID=258505 RepID=A0A7G8PA29_9MYCO|nr:DUF732 domain-containing protein [Mycolicibacterium fluoranthenivorans]QNJ91195.1 DUF732 domain-containing protein [Mycolicibacterium fluoranthenivorans]